MKSIQFEKKIQYKFHSPELLKKALTHSSYTKETGANRIDNNERLEFLGDAFFDAIIGEELYKKLPDVEEGKLTKIRALIVCEDSLAEVGRALNIGQYLKLSRGEEHMGGREKTSIIADAMEAVIGAIFLDGGYDAVKTFVLRIFRDLIENAAAGKIHKDYKSKLQEIAQKNGPAKIDYILEKSVGPDHDKTFFIKVVVGDEVVGQGSGKSKKDAEQNAAKEAIAEKEREEDVL